MLLKSRSKDLRIAAWLTDALLRQEGFAGLAGGLKLCHGLLDTFWDTLYPEIEDGDPGLRAAALGIRLDTAVLQSPLNRDGHGWFQYNESRKVVGYEDEAADLYQKKSRERLLGEGKLAPETFDKSFRETPKAFYVEKSLNDSLASLTSLDVFCGGKFPGDIRPSFGRLWSALGAVREVAHRLLETKRETESD